MSKIKHVHKLRRHIFDSGNKMFFCVLPDCNYKAKCQLTLGKRNICNRCGNEFIMNEYSLRLAKPHCSDCHKLKSGNENGKPFINPTQMPMNHPNPEQELVSNPISLAERLSKLSNKPIVEEEEI